MLMPSLTLWILVVGLFSLAWGSDFPLPVDLKECLVDAATARGLPFTVDGGRGGGSPLLDVACLHDVVPENGARSAHQRFELLPEAFACLTDQATGRVACRGRVGNLVIQSAFSRDGTDEEYTQWQALMQHWLRGRCARYDAPEEVQDCYTAFRLFQYYAPTLESGHVADSWRANLADWTQLDSDPEAYEDANPAAFGAGADGTGRSSTMGEDDVAFLAYLREHGAEWDADPVGVMSKFYSPETIAIVQAELREILQDPTLGDAFRDGSAEARVLAAMLGDVGDAGGGNGGGGNGGGNSGVSGDGESGGGSGGGSAPGDRWTGAGTATA